MKLKILQSSHIVSVNSFHATIKLTPSFGVKLKIKPFGVILQKIVSTTIYKLPPANSITIKKYDKNNIIKC